MVVRQKSTSLKRISNMNWIGVVRVKAKLRRNERRKTDAKLSPVFSKDERSVRRLRSLYATKTLGGRTTQRSRKNFAHRMPILVMRLNTGSVTGRAAGALRRVRRLAALQRAQSRKRYCRSSTRI